MMRYFFIILGLCFLLNNGCNSGPEPLFTIPMELNFSIPPGLNNFDTHYFTFDNVPTFYRNYVNNTTEANVDHVNPLGGIIEARFSNVDWGIMREVAIHVRSPNVPDWNPEALYQDVFRFSGVERIELFPSSPELKDILFNDFVTIEVRLNFRNIPAQEMDVRLNMNFVAYGPE